MNYHTLRLRAYATIIDFSHFYCLQKASQNYDCIFSALCSICVLYFSVLRYEPHRFHDGYLLITVKDRGLLGNGIFLGEALLPLNELRIGDNDQKLADLPQMQLPLTRPSGYGTYILTLYNYKLEELIIFWTAFFADSDVMLALDSRQFDHVAKEFLIKEKRKLWHVNCCDVEECAITTPLLPMTIKYLAYFSWNTIFHWTKNSPV